MLFSFPGAARADLDEERPPRDEEQHDGQQERQQRRHYVEEVAAVLPVVHAVETHLQEEKRGKALGQATGKILLRSKTPGIYNQNGRPVESQFSRTGVDQRKGTNRDNNFIKHVPFWSNTVPKSNLLNT